MSRRLTRYPTEEFMRHPLFAATATAIAIGMVSPTAARAQSFPTDNPTLRRIWAQGMDSSQTWALAQALLDSIGPRLTGTPGIKAGNDWLAARYKSWGIPARNEQYGT